MTEQKNHQIVTKKFILQISYFSNTGQIKLFFTSKINNEPIILYTTSIQGVNEKEFWSEMRKYRKLRFNITTPAIALPYKNTQVQLRKASSSDYYANKTKSKFQENSFGVRYFQRKQKKIQMDLAYDPHHTQVFITILERTKQIVKTAEAAVSLSLLKGKFSPFKEKLPEDELVLAFFKALHSSTAFKIQWLQKYLISKNQLLNPIKLNNTLIIRNKNLQQQQQVLNCDKVQLFRHIFLTELTTHMIVNQFARQKEKIRKYREGNKQYQYQDEELQQLRNLGLRFSVFRDHPFKRKKLKNQHKKEAQQKQYQSEEESEDDYEDDDENSQEESQADIPDSDSSDEEERKQKKEVIEKEQKKKTKLTKMKEKMENKQGISNFTFICGKDKSKINNRRFCLHQMTQETDKTQALMDFIRLVFKLYPKEELVKSKTGIKKKEKMAHFLEQFRTKLQIQPCLEQYTRESFFHKILNTGLRVLKKPYELAYLRLPFSHLFWSIKRIYYRHKAAYLQLKNHKRR